MIATEENINDLQNRIWYIIKPDSLNTENQRLVNDNEFVSISLTSQYKLKLNDIMKLGRVKYAITELCMNGVLDTIDQENSVPVFDLIYEYKVGDISPDIDCKICLSNQEDSSNPMINLCKCTGSMGSHYMCLKYWMQTKLSEKCNEKQTVSSYNMKSFNCEICKTPYPCKY